MNIKYKFPIYFRLINSNNLNQANEIVESKSHNQVNVMMDGSRKVSLRNRQFVRRIETTMPVVSSRVKPSQFYDSQHGEVVDVQDYQGDDIWVSDQGDCEQVPDYLDRDDVTYADDQGNHEPS